MSTADVALDELIAAYRTLDVDLRASPRAIRHRYRELARRYHPDRWPAGSPEAHTAGERMRAINDAYDRIESAPLEHHDFGDKTVDTGVRHSTLDDWERPVSAATETLVLFTLGLIAGGGVAAILYARGVPGIAIYGIALPILLAFAFTSASGRAANLVRLLWWWV